ncbi:MAG: bifunctional 5,10-methylenetetrahydrofolate dehydrogenase/5,10-methenyltetrahydrofolate cyclohydrolase [Opitutales bacterium]|nr:bifunctional 5,10-methylenetetrahydrofolate dehydrogenase/5,10-methenyltetrahydrofolate cyclohydrolase [Opitutales bacterium]
MTIIDGNNIANQIVEELRAEVSQLPENDRPCIHLVRVGEDPASVSYVKKKQDTAAKIGMKGLVTVLPESATQEELFRLLDKLNADPSVHGILVQAPLPKHMSERDTFNHLSADKDVDGLSVVNMGRLVQDDMSGFAPCTPSGIVELLRRTGIETAGKHVVVLGRSLLVGKAAGLLMLQKGPFGDATVTTCHSRTKNLGEVTKQADILIAAIGRPRFVTKDMVKAGAVVIDVGINRIADASRKSGSRLVGDVDYDAVAPLCEAITPVPGGVGPMTVAMLMKNTLKAFKMRK